MDGIRKDSNIKIENPNHARRALLLHHMKLDAKVRKETSSLKLS